MFRTMTNRIGVRLLITIFALEVLSTPAYATMISTGDAIRSNMTPADRVRVSKFLARDDVTQQLKKYGVDPVDVQARVAALTDEEIGQLNSQIDNLPAGAGVVWIVGAVFVVLLILELVGVTNVFTAI